MKMFHLIGGIVLFSIFSLQAQRSIQFEKYTLDNGLKVILHEDHTTPNVVVSVMYHVGSKNEDPDRTGFAHFFEHLLFEGSENLDRGDFDAYISEAGGTNNANTTHDRTYYYESLPSNYLELGLWLESERMLHARVNQKGIEIQREVVKEEKRQLIDNQPYGSILEEIAKRAYQEHPYRWPLIGSMEHLSAATREDFKQFYADFYVPNNAILSIAGDINIAEAKKLIKKYFATIPKKEQPIYRPEIVEPPLDGEIRDTIFDNIQLPAVVQAYRTPAQGTEDAYALEMLGRLMSQGQSSRLYRVLVDEKQLALGAGNQSVPLEDPGVSVSFGICNVGVDPQQVEQVIDEEFEKIKRELIPEREFQKLRNQMESDFISSNSTIAGIAESLANYEMYFGDANLINTEIDRYMAVTREDLMRVAKKYFTKDNRVVLYYLPKAAQP